MMKPNLFIPGAPKSGTSSLHEYLKVHPNIQMSIGRKEPHNYSIDANYINRFDQFYFLSYGNLFKEVEGVIYYGESSTTYLDAIVAPKRIYFDNPNAKFILLLRDPIERIISHYNWLLSLGQTEFDIFQEIMKSENEKLDPNKPIKGNYKNYIGFSKYGTQLNRYLKYFPKENIHIITTENLLSKPKETITSCYDFLGLKYIDGQYGIRNNVTKQKLKDERPFLIKFFSDKLLPLSVKIMINDKLKINKLIKSKFYKRIPKSTLTFDEVSRLKTILSPEVEIIEGFLGRKIVEWKNFV